MSQIWKQRLPLDEGYDHLVIETDHVLSVGPDANGVPSVWFRSPRDQPGSNRLTEVVLYGTGHDVPEEAGEFIGTFVWRTLVLHAFARPVP